MNLVLVTPPIIEPISLTELKLHLRIDSGSFADNIDETILIAPGSHVVANNYTTHVGASKEVLGYTAVVVANYGVLIVGGVVDIKIQESDDNATWTDWATGAFTQVTIAAASSTQEKAYTGTKRYIRTVAKVITQASEFSTTVIRLTATSVEDDLLNAIIIVSREQAEYLTQRRFLTQTWDYFLDSWPDEDFIRLPYGNLQDGVGVAPVITYTNSAGTITTMTVTTQYIVETNGKMCGRIVLPYGVSWPTFTPYPSNPIKIEYVCGWTTAALVPYRIKAAMKMICGDLYENREHQSAGSAQIYFENKTVERLLTAERLWDYSV
jgi:uncharacterized phiE125 gp8 family phage protein